MAERSKWEDFTCKQILVLLAGKGVRKVANFPIATKIKFEIGHF